MIQYNDFTELPSRFQRFISIKLNDGEAIVASWQPSSKEYQHNQYLIQLMGLFFSLIAYVIFWGYGAPPSGLERLSAGNLNWIVCFFCACFMIGGLYFMLMPFWAWSWARRTLYVFTNQRALLIGAKGNFYGCTFEAFEGNALKKAKSTRYKGRANIIFRVHQYEEDGQKYSEDVGFFGIDNPDLAIKLLNYLKGKVASSDLCESNPG